jgi:hypothetical protein
MSKKIIDTILNVLLPVIAGAVIYYLSGEGQVKGFTRNQLPDGLWAYAFFSSILIIWQRKIHVFWMTMVFLVFVLFEIFQYLHFIKGTGDIFDVIIYFVFACIALIPNQQLQKKFYTKPKQTLYAD